MAATLEQWKVLPHGALTEIDTGLLTVVGEISVPLGTFHRRMTVARLAAGGTAVYSAIALDEPEMARIEALGRPAFLIVPNDIHRMDAGIWKARYPELRVLAPADAREKVERVVPVDATNDILRDPEIAFVPLRGTCAREAALVVRRPTGTTLVLNDIVGNVHDAHGLSGLVLRLFGFAGDEPRIPRAVKPRLIDDKAALRVQFLEWADDPTLKRILVSHGDAIEEDPQGVLRHIAESLV